MRTEAIGATARQGSCGKIGHASVSHLRHNGIVYCSVSFHDNTHSLKGRKYEPGISNTGVSAASTGAKGAAALLSTSSKVLLVSSLDIVGVFSSGGPRIHASTLLRFISLPTAKAP